MPKLRIRYIEFILLMSFCIGIYGQEVKKEISASNFPIIKSKGIVLENKSYYTVDNQSYSLNTKDDLLFYVSKDNEIKIFGNYIRQPSENDDKIKNIFVANRNGAGFLGGDKTKITLDPQIQSIFSANNVLGDFSIEFWIYPTAIKTGETILVWSGNTWINNRLFSQKIEARFFEKGIRWDFINFFVKPTKIDDKASLLFKEYVYINSKKELLPNKWSKHVLKYNRIDSKLEYEIDGKVDSIYSLKENEQSYFPFVGQSPNELIIGDNFSGLIDEFRISKKENKFAEFEDGIIYENKHLLIGPIDLGGSENFIKSIDVNYENEMASDLEMHYYQSDFKSLTEKQIYDNKIFFIPGKIESKTSGQYLFLWVDFHEDIRQNQTFASKLRSININYETYIPPPAPSNLVARPKDGQVLLSWQDLLLEKVKGYIVYYGKKSMKNYDSVPDLSNFIDVEKKSEILIDGLENGALYYFMVSSYDDINKPNSPKSNIKNFSNEITSRPSRFAR